MLVGSTVHVGVDKRYIIRGSEWINHNTPSTAKVYVASPKMTFYVKRDGSRFPQDFPYGVDYTLAQRIHTIKTGDFNYAMLSANRNQVQTTLEKTNAAGLILVKRFKNNRDDEVLIFKKE